MLDPFSCLAIATAVVQFIDSAGKFCHIAKETYLVGTTKGNEDVRFLTKDIIDVLARLKQEAQLNSSAQLSDDDKTLFDLVAKCISIGNELEARLNRVSPSGAAVKNKVRRSLRQAISVMWHRGDIESLEARLSDYRQQIDSHILVSLRQVQRQDRNERQIQMNQLSQEHKRLIDQLDKRHDNIIANFKVVETKIDKQIVELERQQKQLDQQLKKRNIELADHIAQQSVQLSQLLQNATLISKSTQRTNPPTREQQASGLIMQALYYRRTHERLRSIEKSHRNTFQWVFKSLKASEYSKSKSQDFLNWLKSGTGCFWISGKAGSGKSSLMRFICDSQEVVDSLCQWSQDQNLIVTTFFFWRAGSDLQKSLQGMLQAILHEVIRIYPELAEALLPDLYKSLFESGGPHSDSITLNELQEAFESLALISQNGYNGIEPFKLCLLVDGIDEFTGDPVVIAEMFKDITRYSSIKIVVSGRPDQGCEAVFEDSPKLRVQDYTTSDIRKYVEDNFASDNKVRNLVEEEQAAIRNLIQEIITKAEGVFLWVVLVVKSLLEGVRYADDVQEFYDRFKKLPQDLEKLYDHILRELRPEYQTEACQLFVFYRAYTEAFPSAELTPICLRSLKMSPHDYQVWMSQDWRESPTRLESLSTKFEERLRSRTKGLLEVRHPGVDDEYRPLPATVQLLHRTLAEFLYDPQQWKKILEQAQSREFDLEMQLCQSLLVRQKQLLSWRGVTRNVTFDRWTRSDDEWSAALTLVRRIQAFETENSFEYVHITTSLLLMLLDQSYESPCAKSLTKSSGSQKRFHMVSPQSLALALGFSGHILETIEAGNSWDALYQALGWLCYSDGTDGEVRHEIYKCGPPDQLHLYGELLSLWVGKFMAYRRICLTLLKSERRLTDEQLNKVWLLALLGYQASRFSTPWDEIIMQFVRTGADLSLKLGSSHTQKAFNCLPQRLQSQIPVSERPTSSDRSTGTLIEEEWDLIERAEVDVAAARREQNATAVSLELNDIVNYATLLPLFGLRATLKALL